MLESQPEGCTDDCTLSPNIEVRLGTEVGGGGGEDWLEQLELRDRGEGSVKTVPAHALF